MLPSQDAIKDYLLKCADGLPVVPARADTDEETARLVYDHTRHIRTGTPPITILGPDDYAAQVPDEPRSFGVYRPPTDDIFLRRADKYTTLSIGLHEIVEGELNRPSSKAPYSIPDLSKNPALLNPVRAYLEGHIIAVEAQVALVESAERNGQYRGELRDVTRDLVKYEEEALDRLRHLISGSLSLRWKLRKFF